MVELHVNQCVITVAASQRNNIKHVQKQQSLYIQLGEKMNERIQELAKEAKLSIPIGALTVPEWIEAYNQKFAELIIRECAQVCRDQPNIYALKADRDNCAIAIEQHFGVE